MLQRIKGWSREEILLAILVLIGNLLRGLQVFIYNPMQNLWSDPLRHWDHAKDSLTTLPMAIFDPVLYQLFLSWVQKMSFGIPVLIGIFVTTLSVLTPWLWYKYFREVLTSKRLACWGWVILIFLPSWNSIFSYFMTETLFLPLLGLAGWMSVRFERKQNSLAFVVAVVSWILASLTRAIAMPMGALLLAILILRKDNKLRLLALVFLLAVVFYLPLSVRNYQSVGLWSPLGNSWLNQIYANSGKKIIKLNLNKDEKAWGYEFGSPSFWEKPFRPFSDWTSAREGQVDVTINLLNNDKDWRESLQQTKMGDNAWLYAENLIYLFWGSSWPDNNPEQLNGYLQIHTRWFWAPFFLLCIFGSIYYWRPNKLNYFFLAPLIVWFVLQGLMLISIAEGRYRKPAEAYMLGQSLILVEAIRRRQKGGLKS